MSPQLEGYRARDVEVLLLTDPVDSFWVRTALGFDGKPFRSVTQGAADLDAIPVTGEAEEEAGDDGAIEVEGMKMDDYQVQAQDTLNDELSNWLFSQQIIELQNARIQWLDQQHGQEPLLLSDVRLLLRTDGDRLQVEGSTALPPGYGSRMNFAIDASGDLTGSGWSADLYLRASGVPYDIPIFIQMYRQDVFDELGLKPLRKSKAAP